MAPESKREPTEVEHRIASGILRLSDGADAFLIGALRTELARALDLTPDDERAFAALPSGQSAEMLADLEETYVHMSSFNAPASGAVSAELRRKLSAISAGVQS